MRTGIGLVKGQRKDPAIWCVDVDKGPRNLRGLHVDMLGPVVVGRSPSSDIVISEPFVSATHARFTLQGPALVLEDLNSTNGTLVNGRSIGEPVTQSLTYYTASENAGQSAAPSAAASVFAGDDDSITADTADTTAQGNAILQQILASDLILDYDQPGYYRSVTVSFCCTGEDSDFLSMLDDMAANYPSVQLVSFSIDTRSFADTDGSAVTATAFNVSLNVILCDKGGVQP